MALSEPNKVRHGKIMSNVMIPYFISTSRITEIPSGKKITSWVWGLPGKRVGNVRSADGAVFELPDAPKSKTDGDSVVMKIVFAYDKYPEEEIRIGKKAGTARIGPRVYAAYRINLSVPMRTSLKKQIETRALTKAGKLNILKGAPTDITPHIYIIVMENMYHNPKRGVVSAKDLYDYVDKKPFLPELRRKINKLHTLGIAHGDMHTRNIIVQIVKSPTGKTRHAVKILDYGRSLNRSRPFRGSSSVNRFLPRGGGTSLMGRHVYGRSQVGRLLQKIAWRQVAGSDSKIRAASVSRSRSYEKSRNASSPSVPKRSVRLPSLNNVPIARRLYGYNVKGRAIHKGPKGGMYVMQGPRKIYKPIKAQNSRLKRGPRGGYYYMRGTRKVYV